MTKIFDFNIKRISRYTDVSISLCQGEKKFILLADEDELRQLLLELEEASKLIKQELPIN